jgi:hypothetical protein
MSVWGRANAIVAIAAALKPNYMSMFYMTKQTKQGQLRNQHNRVPENEIVASSFCQSVTWTQTQTPPPSSMKPRNTDRWAGCWRWRSLVTVSWLKKGDEDKEIRP